MKITMLKFCVSPHVEVDLVHLHVSITFKVITRVVYLKLLKSLIKLFKVIADCGCEFPGHFSNRDNEFGHTNDCSGEQEGKTISVVR
jgi:hypothetical protein